MRGTLKFNLELAMDSKSGFLAKAENPPHGNFWLILSPKDHGFRVTISKNRVGFSEKTQLMREPDPSQIWGIWGSKAISGFNLQIGPRTGHGFVVGCFLLKLKTLLMVIFGSF